MACDLRVNHHAYFEKEVKEEKVEEPLVEEKEVVEEPKVEEKPKKFVKLRKSRKKRGK